MGKRWKRLQEAKELATDTSRLATKRSSGGLRAGSVGAVAVYDNGGETFDRYTVVMLDHPERREGEYAALGLSDNPSHPQGFSQFTTAMPGRHLGKKISMGQLPDDVRWHVVARLR